MAIEIEASHRHWNYFLCIEEDLLHLSRWIDFDEKNYECFSLELARLLMICSSEVDVLAKSICKEIDPERRANSINAYQDVLTRFFPRIVECEVTVRRFGLKLNPWLSWQNPSNPPLWWQSNNKVKHHRSTEFHRATLKNTLNSAAALFVLEMIFHGRLGERYLEPHNDFFEAPQFGVRTNGSVLILG